jgi:hypothetical protein
MHNLEEWAHFSAVTALLFDFGMRQYSIHQCHEFWNLARSPTQFSSCMNTTKFRTVSKWAATLCEACWPSYYTY